MSNLSERRVVLVQVVDSPFCVAIDDGQRVHSEIAGVLDDGQIAVVSFLGVKRLTTAFLNAAIGQLYNEYEEASVRERMRVVDANQQDLALLKKVVDNAKAFFADPRRGEATVKRLTDDE